MEHIFEATAQVEGQIVRNDFTNMEAAARWVESYKAGRVVHFVKGFDNRYRSVSMQVFENDVWRGVSIH